MKKSLAGLFFLITLGFSLEVKEIIQRSDDLMRGKTSAGEFVMETKTPRWTRSISLQSWSEGTTKSFILITAPLRDKGTTFLKINNEMWQYVPKVEKIIKIPPSMMLQSWMGSDFTNDDLVKESSLVDDYSYKLLAEEKNSYQIELIPKPEAAVTWAKIIYWVTKDTYVPLKEEFYDEDGALVRVMRFEEITKLADRYFPMRWVMEPQTEDKQGHSTTVTIKKIVFDQPLEKNIFSMQALKNKSK